MKTKAKLRQSYVELAEPADVRELLKLADAFDAGYDAAKPQWISVKGRLPEMTVSVLTMGADGIIDVVARYKLSEDTWKWGRDGYAVKLFSNITHWMPLPKPPETI